MISMRAACVSQLALLLLAPAMLLDGCALAPSDGGRPVSSRNEPRLQRENTLQTTWRGRPYNALLEAYGSPKMIMNVPGYRPLKTSVVVYGVVDKVTQCIDAFTVVVHGINGEWTVSDYFCR
jgi:hypothetical protein